MIQLVEDTIDNDDITRLIEWLKTYPRLTKGKETEKFEREFSQFVGREYSVFVNSGSSANLLMIYALLQMGILKKGDKVVVPTVSWSTDIAPLMQFGLVPVLCDCNMYDLSLDPEHFADLVEKHDIKAVLLVSVLGLPYKYIKDVVDICDEYDIILLEDGCESLGTKDVGQYGLMTTFSTFFGHQMSTIEGGFICTNDVGSYNILKSIRSHGWARDMDSDFQEHLKKTWNTEDFEFFYTFYYPGFNLRSTDLQAYIGIGQLKRMAEFIKARHENFKIYQKKLENSYWKVLDGQQPTKNVCNFAYPVIHPKKNEIVKKLQSNGVEVRPLITGSMGNQPFFVKEYGNQILMNAVDVDKFGFYVPNHPKLKVEDIEFICNIINEGD